MSEQRKKGFILTRRRIGKSKGRMTSLCYYFVWPLPVRLGRPYQEYKNSSQHSYPGHWGTQSTPHEKVTAPEGYKV